MSEVLLTAMVKDKEDESTYTFATEPHAMAIVNAVVDRFQRRTANPSPWLGSRLGEKVTLVRHGENMLGARMITAEEGRLLSTGYNNSQFGLIPKGARTKGHLVDPAKLLAWHDGWVLEEARQLVQTVREELPELRPLTQERLLELPKQGKAKGCTLAVFGSHPLFAASDVLWLIGEYWPDDDIVERCVLLIRPEQGTSESGSVYGQHLRSMPVGEVVDFKPVSWEWALGLANGDSYEGNHELLLADALGRVHR